MYSDEDLTAFLDGELPAETAGAITAALAKDPALANRLATLEIDLSGLKSAFDSLPTPPVTLPATKPRWIMPALAASIMLALGIGIGARLQAPQTGWEMEVAHYQALYVLETLSVIEPDAERLTQEVAKTSALLGLDMNLEVLDGFDGLTLRRAQVLGFEGQVLIQIAYTMEDGTPVAFCILKRQNLDEEGIETTEMLGMAAASWQNSTHSFLAIGGKDQKLMADFASHLAAAL
ncbi:MAG: hypothetical protein L3J33_05220 [Rhodobacteraceae bacterium]|nr:hypothetical protein [Paracoccaceae bacterium]